MSVDLWAFEKAAMAKGYVRIAGVDEAGRGPLAGPVVSAAVVLPPAFTSTEINDSKQLTERQRERLFGLIMAEAEAVGVGLIDAAEIDRINIFQAARRSMAMAVTNLCLPPDFLLIDGKFGIPSDLPQQAIIKGDSRSISVAAASIIAKVTRDRLMLGYHAQYPQYGLDRHKGYPTKDHKAAVARHGPCAIHRRTFRGVKEHLAPSSAPDQPVRHG
jgi:ribonuclease HII